MKDDLNTLLARRFVPSAPSNLAQSIIAGSLSVSYGPAIRLPEWLGIVLDNVIMPRPAVAFALFLILGVVTGIYMEGHAFTDAQNLSSYLQLDESLAVGEWL